MASRSSFGVKSVLALAAFPLLAIAASACSAQPADDTDEGTSSALSAADCEKIVETSVATSTKECANKGAAADAASAKRTKLEQDWLDLSARFDRALATHSENKDSALARIVAECDAVQCRGELKRGDVKADCGFERTLLRAACYVSHASTLHTAYADLDDEIATLERKRDEVLDAWANAAAKEAWLKGLQLACSVYAGSEVQKAKLYGTCRASCNVKDPTRVAGALGIGWGDTCTPPGFEEVVDDVGHVVECGAYERSVWTAGAICECRQQPGCTQFNALAGSSERGKSCGEGKEKKIVWDAKAKLAALKCL